MNDTKSVLSSKTLWANLIGLGAVLMSLFGIDASGIDSAGLAQAVSQIIAAGSFIASTVFRISATQRIAVM